MKQKRILVGTLLAVLVFLLLNFLGSSFWSQANQLFLTLHAKISLNKKFSNQESIVINFSNAEKSRMLNDMSKFERKILLMNVIESFEQMQLKSINLILSKENKLGIYQNDINSLKTVMRTPIQSMQNRDLELEYFDEYGKQFLLDSSINPTTTISMDELNNGLFEEEKLKDKNIFLLSPNLEFNKASMNKLINYFENRYLSFVPLPKILLAICLLAFSLLMVQMLSPARVVFFILSSTALCALAQISYSFFNYFIEISPLVLGAALVLILLNAFEFQGFSKENIYIDTEDENETSFFYQTETEEENKSSLSQNIIDEIKTDLKDRHYRDFELKLEEYALSFEEASHKNITTIKEKLIELLSENTMQERDNFRLALVKHNFDQLLDNLDQNTFMMAPLRSSNDFVDSLERFAKNTSKAEKINLKLKKDKEPELSSHEQNKVFRVLESLVKLIKEANSESILNIDLELMNNDNSDRFQVKYKGKALDKNSITMKEIAKRLSTMKNSLLSFDQEEKMNMQFINLEFKKATTTKT